MSTEEVKQKLKRLTSQSGEDELEMVNGELIYVGEGLSGIQEQEFRIAFDMLTEGDRVGYINVNKLVDMFSCFGYSLSRKDIDE